MDKRKNTTGGWKGRGRGRGRHTGNNNEGQQWNFGKGRGTSWNADQRGQVSASFYENAYGRFAEASQKHAKSSVEALQSYKSSEGYESSSEEEDLDDVGILSNLTKSYKGGDNNHGDHADEVQLGTTTQYLTESCQSGALTCLVCISSVRRHESIWSCKKCYAILHLKCIKQWVLEGIAQSTLLSDEYFPNRDQPWYCPKCRNEYSRSQCPQSYKCFCGAKEDPPTDPWLLPHSCGGKCSKLLESPACGHRCLLLCHPGPCPPCPQTVRLTCHCGKMQAKPRRCGSGKWSCEDVCGKLLACQKHKCQLICHSGDCTPCSRTSLQSCVCGANRRIQPCLEPRWRCERPCGKTLGCGKHKCEQVCHRPGQCGQCPRAGVRTCPCGKQKFTDISCTVDVATCEDTCGKNLGCFGNHKCAGKCHFGPCGVCRLMATKPCRCGKRKKEVPCPKEYTCETRCQKMRLCGNHQCRRKCCTGDCPDCEQVCGKTLQCKKHKCQMLCHQGPCYPCPLTSQVTCRCGKSSITVVCGKEKMTRPPRCRKPCQIKSDCHHPTRIGHPCHFGDCPRCSQICNSTLACDHICPARCHDNVLVKNEPKALAPWEAPRREFNIVKMPCPPCKVPVPVTCRGGHETPMFACSEAREYSCGRECGRGLKCTNHTCSLMCHVVEGAEDIQLAGTNCATCEEPCVKPRPTGCTHDCASVCHSGDCEPCRKRIRMKCHCGMLPIKFMCSEWTASTPEERDRMMSCGSNCPRTLSSCGHMCPRPCHANACPPSSECSKRVVLRCPCKRRKKDFVCSKTQSQNCQVVCDDECQRVKATKQAERMEEERKKKAEEERKQQEEVEKFERKLHRRSRVRRRGSQDVEDEVGRWRRFRESRAGVVLRFGGVLLVVTAALVFVYYQTEL